MLPGIPDAIRYLLNLILGQPRFGGTAEQLQQISLDDRNPTPSPGMVQQHPSDHTDASGDDWKLAKRHTGGRHGGSSRSVSGTGARRCHGEDQPSRKDHPQSHLPMQSGRSKKLENDYHRLADEHKSLARSYNQLLEERQIAITDLQQTKTTCREQQQEIDTLRERHRAASALLDVRNQELKVTKTFLSKEDLLSTSDVVQSVRDLNFEIMHTAIHLAERLPLKRFRAPLAEEVPEGPCKSIFVTLIFPRGSEEEADMASLELALQGSLASYASQIANIWSLDDAFCWYDRLYSNVCETEDHAVASNWRVLTRRTLSHMDSNREDLSGQVVNKMVNQLAELLSSCGVGNSVDNVNDIQKYGSEKLGALFTAARKLNKTIGENIVSEDLMVSVICGGTMFDGECMEDAYGAGAGSKPGQRAVVCTTDLGLCERKEKKGVGKILLKPKVFLRDS